MARIYWRRVHQRALEEARHTLGIETGGRAMIAIVVAVVAIFAIWFIAPDIAQSELLIRLSLIAVIVLFFPFVYVWKLFTVPAELDAEAQAEIQRLEQTKATLTLSGPHLHNDHRFKNKKSIGE